MPADLRALMQDNGPFALTTSSIWGREQAIFRHGAKTLPEIYRKASSRGQSPFLVVDDAIVTIEELFGRAGSYARFFAARGIGKSTRVAIGTGSDCDWMAVFIAVTALGAVAVLMGETDRLRQFETTGCRMAVLDNAGDIDPRNVICTDALGPARSQYASLPNWDIAPEQEACIAFTSGSTGAPKGVILTHRGLTTGLMNMMLAGAFAARSGPQKPAPRPALPAVLLRTPLNHVSGYMQMLLMLTVGGRLVRSKHSAIRQLIADHQITAVTGISDEEIEALLDAPLDEAVNPLRSIAVVGRNLPAQLRRRVREKLPSLGLGAGYGLTETNGLVCAVGNAQLDARPHAVGPLLPTVECRITREDGGDCAAGESGEIRLRGAMLMQGYCNEETASHGWFATGDIGYISDDGYLHVLDKEDRFLRAAGRHISCREIEDAIQETTGLLEVAALPVDNGDGERLLIVTAPGPRDFSGIRDSLASRFPMQLVRRARFIAAERLPRTASGKIAYARLRQEASI